MKPTPMDHPRTILATVATIGFLVFPGLLVGAVAKAAYGWLLVGYVGHGWLAEPALAWFPDLLHGLVAGGMGAWLAARVVRGADFNAVAYGAGAVAVALYALLMNFVLGHHGISLGAISVVAGGLGVVVGVATGCQSAAAERIAQSR